VSPHCDPSVSQSFFYQRCSEAGAL
jgi:hypothetical protein